MISTLVDDQQAVDDLLLPILEHLEKGNWTFPSSPMWPAKFLL